MELDELVIGTIFLTMFYFIAGINKLRHFKSSTKSFAKKFPIASLFSGLIIALVIAIEILAPITMVYAAFSPSHEIYGFTGSIYSHWIYNFSNIALSFSSNQKRTSNAFYA